MKNGVKKITAALLSAALAFTLVNAAPSTCAKTSKKPTIKLSKSSTLTKGETKKLKIKTSGIKKIVSVKWKSSKKSVAKITKSSLKIARIKAVKAGKAKISATVKYKEKASSKTKVKKVNCAVTVKSAGKPTPPQNSAPPTLSQTAAPTPTPKPTRTPGPQNLFAALSDYMKNVGSCVSYNSWGNSALDDADTKAYIKENFNSITAENEMKPESILGRWTNKITTVQARQQGIYIPENYTENYVPLLDYTSIDTLMKFASENGLRIRYHGLIWHEQTPNWFFRTNYSDSGKFVTPEIMDARLEYYIKNVMNHVYSSQYADTVYCWDVVNEFYHMTECIYRIENGQKDKTDNVKCYYNVYGQEIFEDPSSPETSKVVDNPRYVKLAFKWAHEVLEQFGLVGRVELVYNDYDTDFADVRASVLAVTKYINEKDSINPNGDKLVTTIGMQTHDVLGVHFIADHKASMDAFKATGLNLQVTEMDLRLNNYTVEDQLKYWEDFIRLVIDEAKSGANFTGFTWWGLCDSKSWFGVAQSPLLCGSSVKDKKPAYYKVIETAYSVTID